MRFLPVAFEIVSAEGQEACRFSLKIDPVEARGVANALFIISQNEIIGYTWYSGAAETHKSFQSERRSVSPLLLSSTFAFH